MRLKNISGFVYRKNMKTISNIKHYGICDSWLDEADCFLKDSRVTDKMNMPKMTRCQGVMIFDGFIVSRIWHYDYIFRREVIDSLKLTSKIEF